MSAPIQLNDAIEALYETFSRYDLRERIVACNHCHGSTDDRLLRSEKLRNLGINELHHYIWDAMTTWGDDYDFRHFLRRILGLYSFEDSVTNDRIYPEVAFGKLHYANWSKWPMDEQISVRQFLLALWKSKIDSQFAWDEYAPSVIEDWLTAIGRAEDNLEPYLSAWLDSGSAEALANLSHFIVCNREYLSKGKLINAYWAERQSQARQVIDWLLGERVRKLLIESAERDRSSLTWNRRALETVVLLRS